MSALSISLAVGPYDRTKALTDGRVSVEGVDLNPMVLHPAEIFLRMSNGAEFDVAEMSLGAYTIGLSRGDDRFVAIPVFPSRAFRHRDMFVTAADGHGGETLRGGRIGVHRLHMTATIWQRGVLSDAMGIQPQDVKWVQAGVHQAGVVPGRIRLRVPEGVTIDTEPERSIDQMLCTGELTAALLSHPPASFTAGDPRIQRMFPDPIKVETDYFLETGVFPIMHVVVIRRSLHEAHPWLASTLTKAFSEAKQLGYDDSANQGYSPHMMPFFDLHQARERALLGGDFYPYGVEANRPTLEAFLRHCRDQGLLTQPLTADDLFIDGVMLSDEVDAIDTPGATPGPDDPDPAEKPGETWRWD